MVEGYVEGYLFRGGGRRWRFENGFLLGFRFGRGFLGLRLRLVRILAGLDGEGMGLLLWLLLLLRLGRDFLLLCRLFRGVQATRLHALLFRNTLHLIYTLFLLHLLHRHR